METITGKLKSNLVVFASFIAFAVINWPFSGRAIESNILYPIYCLSAAFVIGVLGVALLKDKPDRTAIKTMVGFLLALVARILFDWIQDPTSHNLFPFELILIVIYSLPPSLLGAWLTWWAMKLFRKNV